MNTIQKQFSDALKREGKTITTYYKNETVPCLFRKNNDNNSTDNHITIFYDVSAPISQGQLLSFNGKCFITLNKETIENDYYNKSALLECNIDLPIVINGRIKNIPCHVGELQSPTVIEGKVITTLDGRLEIMTESKDEINNIEIDTKFNLVGGYYELKNKYNKSGISYLYVERTLESPKEYLFEITSDNTEYTKGTTTQLTAKPTINGAIDETAHITYSSSDETVAKVDDNGIITFIAEGSVIITGTWIEQSLTDTLTLSVVAGIPDTPNYTMSITANDELAVGMTSTFTPHLKDDGGAEQPFTAVWDINYNGIDKSYLNLTYSDNLCKVKVDDNAYDIIDMDLILTCTTDDGLYSATYTSKVTIGF